MKSIKTQVDKEDPRKIKEVVLGKNPITIQEFIAVARYNAKVSISTEYCERVKTSRNLLEKFINEKRVIYGVTTGFGENVNKVISLEDNETLQKNVLLASATSVGQPLEKEVVRGIVLMKLLNLGQGYSGVRLELLEFIIKVLNENITPYAPQHGSVGYLCIEAHIALLLIGKGKAWYKDDLLPSHEALKKAGLKPITLASKEGLALTSGTTSVTALTALALYDALNAVKVADIVGAMSVEALKGTIKAFDLRIHLVRPHEEQIKTAKNLQKILADSEIAKKYKEYRTQDALSLRCIPQLHGAVKKKLKDALKTILIEMNSCCDNPLIFPEGDDGIVLSGGKSRRFFCRIRS